MPISNQGMDMNGALPTPAALDPREQEQNFRLFFDTIEDFLFVLDMQGCILQVNRHALTQLGYRLEELVGQPVTRVHPADHKDDVLRVAQAMFEGKASSCPIPLARKDGRTIPVYTRIVRGRWSGQDVLFGVSKDLTAVKSMEEKFLLAFQNSPSLMAISTMEDGRFIEVNQAFLRVLGYQRDELIKHTSGRLNLFAHPEQRDELIGLLREGQHVYNREVGIRAKDGSIRIGLFSADIIELQSERCLLTVMHDITEQKQVTEELQRSHALLSGLLDSIPDIIFFKDLHGVYLGCNPEFAQLVNRTPAGVVGATDYDLFPKEAADFFREKDAATMQQGQPVKNEEWIVYPDGRKILIETVKAPLRFQSGELLGLVGVSRDITELKRSAEIISEREACLRAILDNFPFLVWLKDKDGRFLAVNELFAQSCGQPHAAALSGKTDLDIWPKELAELYRADDREVMDRLAKKNVEEPIADQGTRKWFETFKTPIIDQEGKLFGTTGFSRDITERKQAEEALRVSQEALREMNNTLEEKVQERTRQLQEAQAQLYLHEKLASIGQLAAGIAHEINNPISFVATNFATLNDNVRALREILAAYRNVVAGTVLPESAQVGLAALRERERELEVDFILSDLDKLFVESRDGFKRINSIINSMRDFARMDPPDALVGYDLNKGVEETLVISRNAYKYHADIKTELGELPEIYCRPGQVNQVLLNLVMNAAQATAEVEASRRGRIRIRTWADPDWVYCEVEDNGEGIKPEIQRRIFEPFFTTKDPGQGMGLGLSICYDIIVNKHHGRLTVGSEPGQGARFRLSLPWAQPDMKGFTEKKP